jgi:N-acetylmuramoyl-L-alanine amidase
MNGQDPYEHDREGDDSRPEATPPESPASVVFMELMRRHAAADGEVQEEHYTLEPVPADPPQDVTPQLSDEERRRAAALEAQRIKRVKRRQERRRQKTVSAFGGVVRSLLVVTISAGLIATILSWWTSPDSLDPELGAALSRAQATDLPILSPTPRVTPNWMRRVGVVSGHRGPENDPGAVCPDGLTENEINFAVAQQVVLKLREYGFTVDLLDEFDPRLEDYEAVALVSLHANDCSDYGSTGTGYLVAQAETRPEGSEDTRLRECVASHYEVASGLPRHFGLTRDMTDYHIFREIKPTTPGVILEMGFMLLDRSLLTQNQDQLAEGIVSGILCYLEPGDSNLMPTPPPSLGQSGG